MSDTVLMVHGMWTGGWLWNNYRKIFEGRGYKCLTPTLRYHNLEYKDNPDERLGTTSLLDYASDLEKEIKKLNEKPIIVGHSMGGMLAQILGSRGLAKAIVLLTPALPAGVLDVPPDPESAIKGWGSILANPNWFKEPMKPNFDEAVYLELQLLPENEQKAVYDKWVYESGWASFELTLWQSDPNKAAFVDKSKVTCPVLVIAAAEDNCLPPTLIKKVAEYYHGVSTYKEFPNHAHWLVGEPGWQDVAEYVCDWLSNIR
ncbi:MAG: alpha/beta hydrolase [Desulfotomaculum sp. BICA1-6]|nr:MAG: alpha/beta hydrolase [Desulfotomaculum sp. BICA1-6]